MRSETKRREGEACGRTRRTGTARYRPAPADAGDVVAALVDVAAWKCRQEEAPESRALLAGLRAAPADGDADGPR